MIYDCFNFYNELELLEIRLNELNGIVDKFILAEATVTFTNKPKPLYYFENKEKFKKFNDKIIHVVIKDSPNVTNPWIIEHHQLASVVRGLPKCKAEDIVLVSCVDEIPKAKTILKWKDKPGRHKAFMQDMSFYYLNCVNHTGPDHGLWSGTRMFTYENMLSFHDVYTARFTPIDVKIPDGGWHFNYMGGVKRVQNKLAAFSHQEFNNDNYNTPENITKSMLNHADFLNKGLKFKIVNENFLPQYVIDNRTFFSKWIIPESNGNPRYIKFRLLIIGLLLPIRKIIRKILSFYRNL